MSEAVLVDGNVLLDIVTDDPKWADWSERALIGAADSSVPGREVLRRVPPARRQEDVPVA